MYLQSKFSYYTVSSLHENKWLIIITKTDVELKHEHVFFNYSYAKTCVKIVHCICGTKIPTRCNRGFYCRSYCLHLVGILFPHINDDARSKSHQICSLHISLKVCLNETLFHQDRNQYFRINFILAKAPCIK